MNSFTLIVSISVLLALCQAQPSQEGSGSGSGKMEKPECPIFESCTKDLPENWMEMQDESTIDTCLTTVDTVRNCMRSHEPLTDYCQGPCKPFGILASESLGSIIAKSKCPKPASCPEFEIKHLKMLSKMMKKEGFCNNTEVLKMLQEKRQELDSYKGDLIQCDPSGIYSESTFEMLESMIEAKCGGCNLEAAKSCFEAMKPTETQEKRGKGSKGSKGQGKGKGKGKGKGMKGSACDMLSKIETALTCAQKTLASQDSCSSLIDNSSHTEVFLAKTLGRVCEAEKEYKTLCGAMNAPSTAEKRSLEEHHEIVRSFFVEN